MKKNLLLATLGVAVLGGAAMLVFTDKAVEYHEGAEAIEKTEKASSLVAQSQELLWNRALDSSDAITVAGVYINAYTLLIEADRLAPSRQADSLIEVVRPRLRQCRQVLEAQLTVVKGMPDASAEPQRAISQIDSLLQIQTPQGAGAK